VKKKGKYGMCIRRRYTQNMDVVGKLINVIVPSRNRKRNENHTSAGAITKTQR
jgi:hypothetical protein